MLDAYLIFDGDCADTMRFYERTLGGKVTMPLQKTFWVEAFGMLVERFGTPWMVNGGTANV
jgi:PhnB protein